MSLGDMKNRKAISIRKGHEVGSDAYGTGDIPFVRTSDVNNFEISFDPTKSVGEAVYEEQWSAKVLGIPVFRVYLLGLTAKSTDLIMSARSVGCLIGGLRIPISLSGNSMSSTAIALFAVA